MYYNTPYFGNNIPNITSYSTLNQQPQNNNYLQPLSNSPNNNFNMYNQQANNPTTAQSTEQSSFTIRPVQTSEEAYNYNVDFDGKTHIFTDFNNGYIYIKTANYVTNTIDTQVYKLQPNKNLQAKQYLTQSDLKSVLDDITNIKNTLGQVQQDFNKIQTEWGTIDDKPTTK